MLQVQAAALANKAVNDDEGDYKTSALGSTLLSFVSFVDEERRNAGLYDIQRRHTLIVPQSVRQALGIILHYCSEPQEVWCGS